MEYSKFLSSLRACWEQGDHLTIVGPTSAGKTYLAADILGIRRYVAVIATKRTDSTFARFPKSEYKRQKEFAPIYPHEKYFVWSKPALGDFATQRAQIASALKMMYETGGWTPYLDDAFYLCNSLKLDNQLRMLYTLGRSEHITMVASLQRPRRVPIEMLSQSGHVLLMRLYDDKDIDRVAEETGKSPRAMRDMVHRLHGHSFIWTQNKAGKPPVIVRRA